MEVNTTFDPNAVVTLSITVKGSDGTTRTRDRLPDGTLGFAYLTPGVWQPIETAPNEQKILMFCPKYVESHSYPYMLVGIGYGPTNVWNEQSWHDTVEENEHEPTHWMPLPEPPK